MPATLPELLAQAVTIGLRLHLSPSGRLVIQARNVDAETALALRAHEDTLTDWLTHGVSLDWSAGHTGQSRPCAWCQRPALCRDPATRRAAHKTCAERRVTQLLERLTREDIAA